MGNKILGDLFPANWNRVTIENVNGKASGSTTSTPPSLSAV